MALDIYIDHDQSILWIKTADRQILKLTDSYHPSFYILPQSETDGLYLFQILSRQQDIVGEDTRVKQLFNADLSHIQQYLFTKLRIEPTSKVKVEYSGAKLREITKRNSDHSSSNHKNNSVSN